MQQSQSNEEFLRILIKGLVTLPKSWREELNLKEGQIVKAKKVAQSIIIEPVESKPSTRYRLFSDKEIKQWIKEDKLPRGLAKKAAAFWADIP